MSVCKGGAEVRARDLLRLVDWARMRSYSHRVAIRDDAGACPVLHVLGDGHHNGEAVGLAVAAGIPEEEARAVVLASDLPGLDLLAGESEPAMYANPRRVRRRARRYRRWMLGRMATP